ncbi:hypothetical protein ABT383_40305 [Streptomyces humidus]|uniref:hypothetical protein n=1 Tax=Streptomyces humidus TaxID=52259 RepID=UPI001E2EC042|nr:hypothetical protein [Streptomyces humidus]
MGDVLALGPLARASDERALRRGLRVSAEFNNVLQSEADAAKLRQLNGEAVSTARVRVLDIGMGTGRDPDGSLAGRDVSLHAIEPARPVCASLMTRLASLPPTRPNGSPAPSPCPVCAVSRMSPSATTP